MQHLALFDLDNTLVDRAAAFRRWAAGFRAEHDLPAEDLAWMHTVDDDGYTPRTEFFAAVKERFGLAEPVDDLWARYRRRMPELTSCRPSVRGMLTTLRQKGWSLAIVTNGEADQQTGKIRRTELDRHVDAWAVSGEVGIRKPERGLFEAAARGCGLDLADGGWMIGDSPAKDVAGGREAGLSTVWISRGRQWPADLEPPDHVCTDVEAATAVLLASH